MVLAGEWRMASWVGPAQVAEVADIKGVVEFLVDRLHAGRVEYAATEALAGVEHPGRTAAVVLAGEYSLEIGRVGELDPRYLRANELRTEHVTFALLDLDELKRRADAPVSTSLSQAGSRPSSVTWPWWSAKMSRRRGSRMRSGRRPPMRWRR